MKDEIRRGGIILRSSSSKDIPEMHYPNGCESCVSSKLFESIKKTNETFKRLRASLAEGEKIARQKNVSEFIEITIDGMPIEKLDIPWGGTITFDAELLTPEKEFGQLLCLLGLQKIPRKSMSFKAFKKKVLG